MWAGGVQAQAAVWAREGIDPEPIRLITQVVLALGKLRHLALDSEDAVKLLGHYRGIHVDTTGNTPPDNPLALACWAWWQIAGLLYSCLTAPIDERQLMSQVRALAAIGAMYPTAEFERLTEELDGEDKPCLAIVA